MPRRVLVAPLAVCTVAVSAAVAAPATSSKPQLATKLARALAVPHVQAKLSGAAAVDLSTGRTVFLRNPRLSLVPASNAKLAVAYASLALLGPQHRLDTAVYGEGELVGATWNGDLVLKGFGDPTLSRDDLGALARQIRAAGIRQVTGGIEADESYFDSRRTGPAWRSYYYVNESPPLSALTVDRSRFRGWMTRDPARAAGTQFRLALRTAGVGVRGKVVTGVADPSAEQLAITASAPLARIVAYMNRESDNFTAELLLKQLGAVDEGRGTSAGGAEVVRRALHEAAVPLAGVRIVDGSGLSSRNRLTAAAVIGILVVAWNDPAIRPSFVRSLAVAGVNGTLEDRLERPPARGAVLAKTGTLRESSALSGYARGRWAFAVIQNGRPVSQFWARRAQDRFASVLAGQ
ncbi:MAG: D-alanyl-D-alanine carboxypeptidase/D-alanyl-D-alanine-endopeptidase [Actinomycetota bacterium]|nr:D-alanyl-D-alanine carboxypeptidase/D-alanyl-D-alanine-endopeptidase [Actinomycetota bacterium]